MISLGSQGHGGISHMTGGQLWMDVGFSGRTGKESKGRGCHFCKGAEGKHGTLPWMGDEPSKD